VLRVRSSYSFSDWACLGAQAWEALIASLTTPIRLKPLTFVVGKPQFCGWEASFLNRAFKSSITPHLFPLYYLCVYLRPLAAAETPRSSLGFPWQLGQFKSRRTPPRQRRVLRNSRSNFSIAREENHKYGDLHQVRPWDILPWRTSRSCP
jgi:hypothetical protein